MNDNLIIAKFMGWTVEQNGSWFYIFKPGSKSPTSHKSYCAWGSESTAWLAIQSKVEYDSSWDHLMPVIQKISEIGRQGESIKGLGPQLHMVLSMELDTELRHAYAGVIDFIKWYNENR
jgi:hypothetical protein